MSQTFTHNAIKSWPNAQIDNGNYRNATPNEGTVGQRFVTNFRFDRNDPFRFKRFNLEMKLTTSDTTNHCIFQNSYRMFSEFSYTINRQFKRELLNINDIDAQIAYTARKEQNNWFHWLQTHRGDLTSGYTGDNLSTGTLYVVLDLNNLFPELEDIDTMTVEEIEFIFSLHPNYATADGIGRFCLNATTTNGWTSDKIKAQNVLIRAHVDRYDNFASIPRPKNPHMLINKWECKEYSTSWNVVGTDSKSINLEKEFLPRTGIQGVLAFVYPKGRVTTYNDADCNKIYSNSKYFSWKVVQGSRTPLDMYDATITKRARTQYLQEFNLKRFGQYLLPTIENEVDLTSNYFLPAVYIDLTGHSTYDADTEVFSGITNLTNDLEIVFGCASAVDANCTLVVCLHNVEFGLVNGKNITRQFSKP